MKLILLEIAAISIAIFLFVLITSTPNRPGDWSLFLLIRFGWWFIPMVVAAVDVVEAETLAALADQAAGRLVEDLRAMLLQFRPRGLFEKPPRQIKPLHTVIPVVHSKSLIMLVSAMFGSAFIHRHHVFRR